MRKNSLIGPQDSSTIKCGVREGSKDKLSPREGAAALSARLPFSSLCALLSPLSPHTLSPPSFLLLSPCSPITPLASPFGPLPAPGHPGCTPDSRNHAGYLCAPEPHSEATGPRGGPAARLSPGQLLHDRGRRGPARVSPPTGQVPSEGGFQPLHFRGLI